MTASLPNQKNLISISQAAKFLGVSIDTVRRWDKSGVLHSQRPDGKNRYFSQSELEEHKSSRPLTISEASKELGISPTTLRRLESKGLLAPERNNAGERVYDKDSIKNFLVSDYFLRKKTVIEQDSTEEHINQTEDNNPPAKSSDETPRTASLTQISSLLSLREYDKSSFRMPEILAAFIIFALLTAIGATNVTLAQIKTIQSSQTPAAVLSETIENEPQPTPEPSVPEKTPAPEPDPTAQPITLQSIQSLIDEAADYTAKVATEEAQEKKDEKGGPDLSDFKMILSIKTSGTGFVNIREKPSTESAQIGKAMDGETFEMVSRIPDWYEIKLNDSSNGFISEEFAQIKEIN